jgi:hypothetical protein
MKPYSNIDNSPPSSGRKRSKISVDNEIWICFGTRVEGHATAIAPADGPLALKKMPIEPL